MVVCVTRALCRYWPWTSSSKQVLMLNELEEVLELCAGESLGPAAVADIVRVLTRCVETPHFQVCERALAMWQNGALSRGLLGWEFAHLLLPSLFPALRFQASGHWNPSVESLAKLVLRHYEDVAQSVYQECMERSAGGESM